MISDEPMSAGKLGALWPMAAEVGWERKWGIVTWVGSFPEGTWVDGAELGTMVGIHPARARVQLLELHQARILDRDGGDGGRKFWYRVNPRWREWRIRWRFDLQGVELRLARWEQQASRHPLELISARPNGARYRKISARLMARATEEWARANDPLARAIGARANSTFEGVDNPIARAIGARANEIGSARPRARANPGPAAGGGISLSRDGSETTPPAPEAPAKDGPEWRALRRAVLERCADLTGRGAYLQGKPARLLRVLVDRHGIEAITAALDAQPAGVHGPPRFVEGLADILDGGAGVETVDAPPAVSAETLRAQLAGVKQHMAAYTAEDAPIPPDLQSDHDRLLAQLAEFDLTITSP